MGMLWTKIQIFKWGELQEVQNWSDKTDYYLPIIFVNAILFTKNRYMSITFVLLIPVLSWLIDGMIKAACRIEVAVLEIWSMKTNQKCGQDQKRNVQWSYRLSLLFLSDTHSFSPILYSFMSCSVQSKHSTKPDTKGRSGSF